MAGTQWGYPCSPQWDHRNNVWLRVWLGKGLRRFQFWSLVSDRPTALRSLAFGRSYFAPTLCSNPLGNSAQSPFLQTLDRKLRLWGPNTSDFRLPGWFQGTEQAEDLWPLEDQEMKTWSSKNGGRAAWPVRVTGTPSPGDGQRFTCKLNSDSYSCPK